MSKIINIADPAILTIPIAECQEPLIDIKLQREISFGPPPECELTTSCYTKMRRTVYEKLCQAQTKLPSGWRFRLYEGFRNLKVQQILFTAEYERVRTNHPNKEHQFYHYQATRLVSPVINLDGSRNIPAHNTGGAIDIEVIDVTGQLIDMGMALKDWPVVDVDLCSTYTNKISATAQQNRLILLEAMQSQGFVNYPTEWWHFSYGDRYWAYFQTNKKAIYGSADQFFKQEEQACSL